MADTLGITSEASSADQRVPVVLNEWIHPHNLPPSHMSTFPGRVRTLADCITREVLT